MILKRDILYKVILTILFITPLLIPSVEVNIVLISLISIVVFINDKHKYTKALVNIISPLLAILLIAIFSTLFFKSEAFNCLKDFFFLAKPILYILMGYFIVGKIKDKEFAYKAIIYLAVFFALLHIYHAFTYLSNNEFDINLLRNNAGRGNVLEIFAFVLLLSKKGRFLCGYKPKYQKLIISILITSFILYFSRTATVSILILFLSINGYLAITRKGLVYITGFVVAVSLFYIYLFSVELERGAPGIEGFLYKMKIAPEEIFNSEIDTKDHSDLWDHWRAYEALKAFEQIYDTPYYYGLVAGKGIGSLVDLGFVAPLNNEGGMQYITTLHNGYAYIAFKSGFIGLIFFIVFLLSLYLYVYLDTKNPRVKIINNLLSGIAIYYMFTTLIVSGVYNPRDFIGIIIGILLCLKHYHKTNILKD